MLSVRKLSVRFHDREPPIVAVDHVSFDLQRGESLGLIGESGSGKTTLALSIARLLPVVAEVTGRVELSGRSLLDLSGHEMARVRGAQIGFVFHDPLAALNPVLRIRTQIAECLPHPRSRAVDEGVAVLLRTAGLAPELARRYPHELSGGMRARTLIAMALAGEPSLLIADEPTSSLDTVAQAEVASLLRAAHDREHLALLLVTHDPSLAARICDRIAVLYAGRIVEMAPAADLLARPLHPYTAGLCRSVPPAIGEEAPRRIQPVPGAPARQGEAFGGCRFRQRCPSVRADCARDEPELVEIAGRQVACFHPVAA